MRWRMARSKKKQKTRPIEKEDICRIKTMSGAALSPDEKRIAYTVESVSKDKKKYFSHLHLAELDTGEFRRFTFGEISDHSPVWSSDGSMIAFISTRDKKSGIYAIASDGGEARKVIEMDGSFGSINWTPDGKEIVFNFRYNDSHDEKDEKKKKEAPLFRHVTRLFYRLDALGFLPEDRFHIWKVDVASGETKQLTKGKFDETGPTVSPDGKTIAFTSNRSQNPDKDWFKIDLFTIPIDGGKMIRIKTPAGPVECPVFSPDSKKIAYIGHDNPDDSWGETNLHLWTVGAKGRPAARDMIEKFDRSCGDDTIADMGESHEVPRPIWSSDGKRIYFMASDTGSTHIFYAPSKGGLPTRITEKLCHVKGFSLNGKTRTIAAIVSDLGDPNRLVTVPVQYHGDRKTKLIHQPNRDLLDEINLPRIKEVWFKGHDGTELQGWLVTPHDFKKSKKYPAILEIHGGPRAQYGFSFFHEMNWLASQGYVVFYTNPRGGTGRGETFAAAITGGWGEIDYFDCMSAADYMEKLKFVNPRKIGVTGGSYGGYMTNWIIGQTNRFKAAVTQRSVVNLESFYGSSDIGYSLYREFDGQPWENPENYRKYSPLTYAKNIRTPLLIIHSEKDLRCSIEQAEELFAVLKMMNRKVEFVRFPEEPHGLSRHGRPDRRIARLEWILKWFKRYLR